jgi:hypothetical protein
MSSISGKKHPREFGFTLGIEAIVDRNGLPTMLNIALEAKRNEPVVYVALVDDTTVLKVGISKNGLHGRWKGIFGVMDQRIWPRLKPNEIRDGEKLIAAAANRSVAVWLKAPIRVNIPYASEVTSTDYCGRFTEEIFLDQYYLPVFGKRL